MWNCPGTGCSSTGVGLEWREGLGPAFTLSVAGYLQYLKCEKSLGLASFRLPAWEKGVWGAGSAHGCEHRVLCCLHRPGQRGGKEKSLACLLGIAWLPQPWRRGSAHHPTEKLPRHQGLLHKNCPIPCLHPSVSQLFSYRLAQTPLFFLLLPLTSILPNPDHIH